MQGHDGPQTSMSRKKGSWSQRLTRNSKLLTSPRNQKPPTYKRGGCGGGPQGDAVNGDVGRLECAGRIRFLEVVQLCGGLSEHEANMTYLVIAEDDRTEERKDLQEGNDVHICNEKRPNER